MSGASKHGDDQVPDDRCLRPENRLKHLVAKPAFHVPHNVVIETRKQGRVRFGNTRITEKEFSFSGHPRKKNEHGGGSANV